MSSAGELADRVLMPPTAGWDLRRASVATWVTVHLAVVVCYLSTVVSAADRGHRWQLIVITLWLLALSGLTVRIARLLVTSSPAEHLPPPASPRRYGVELKLGMFIMMAYLALLAATSLGRFAVGGHLAILTLTTGLRVAGVDAASGRIRAPLFYLRSVVSRRGLVALGSLIVIAGTIFTATELALGSVLIDAETRVEEITGIRPSRGQQFRWLIVGVLTLTPPVILVCEAIASVSRLEASLNDRLAAQERRLERDGIAQDIHDGVILSTLAELRRTSTDDRHRRLIDSLDTRLRRLQHERLAAREDRSIRSGLRRPFQHANSLGLELELETDRTTLRTVAHAVTATLVERLVMIQVSNSADAAATTAHLSIAALESRIEIRYSDDGGGFDPSLIDRRSGGLSRLRHDIEAMGGSLDFIRFPDRTESVAALPRKGVRP